MGQIPHHALLPLYFFVNIKVPSIKLCLFILSNAVLSVAFFSSGLPYTFVNADDVRTPEGAPLDLHPICCGLVLPRERPTSFLHRAPGGVPGGSLILHDQNVSIYLLTSM